MYNALRVFRCKVARVENSTRRKYLSVEFESHQKLLKSNLQWQKKSSNRHVIEHARLRSRINHSNVLASKKKGLLLKWTI